ncbi:MAG: coxB [Ornithinibacter sp.]|nr:coxB [Ornithinibacter sp.]
MRQHDLLSARRPLRRFGSAALVGVLSVAVLSGCAADELRGSASTGWLPPAVTENGEVVTNLWIGAWIAALAVGALVWGLVGWCVVAYRRRRDDTELPVQLRYNIPIEILYTVVPIFTGERGAPETVPTLFLPVGERVEFVLTARDVIHSFWVPAFLQKMDMIPGRVNAFQVVTTQEGTFKGKCAELCGTYHSQMLFNVKVVPRAEYDQHIADLRAKGQTGLLNNTLNREELMNDPDPVSDDIDGGN